MSTDSYQYKSTFASSADTKIGTVNLDEAQGIVECFVSGIGNKDSVGDIVASGAFTKSLQRRKPRVVWGHNWNDPIGKVLEIYEVPSSDNRLPLKMKVAGIGGLFARVQFNLNSDKGREAFANVAFFGEEQEWSIGYKTLRAQYDQKSQANIIYELELYEVSPVLHGANQLTGTISVKADEKGVGVIDGMPMAMPMEQNNINEQVSQELAKMMGSPVSGVEVDEENGMVSFSRPNANGQMAKFKCPFSRGHGGRFMFGAPEMVVVPKPVAMPMAGPGMPSVSPMPPNEPQRIVRPTQMPSIPVAIKPGEAGVVMVPLPPVQYENNDKPIDKNNLSQEEADLRDALRKIVKRHGKLNEDSNGIWAGYTPAIKNPVAGIGVKCANCVFYKEGNSCEIIDMPIEPEGKCRFAVIPDGVVKGDINLKKQYEIESENDENDYLAEFEFKYPGELVMAVLRGAVGRKRRKKRKYKHLAEFGYEEDDGTPYYLPVLPKDAFYVKQLLDPIFDYHRVESFVDTDGIVMSSGVTVELIDAIDNAFDNLKKKDLVPDDINFKISAYRIGRSLGSTIGRGIDRPNLSGRRTARRFFTSRGAEDFDPRTADDVDLDGIVGEGLFLRGVPLEQQDPTPEGPGSIRNPKPSRKPADMPSAERGAQQSITDYFAGKKPDSPYVREPAKPRPSTADDYVREPAKIRKPSPDDIELLSTDSIVREPAKPRPSRADDYVREPAKPRPSTADDYVREPFKGSDGYGKYLATSEDKRKIKDVRDYEGFLKSGMLRLSSGGEKPEELKDGQIIPADSPAIDQVYKEMAEAVIDALNAYVNNPTKEGWKMPWHVGRDGSAHNPTNVGSVSPKGRYYEGSNRLMLNHVLMQRGYTLNRWATAKQWKKQGGKLKPNARPVQILVPQFGDGPFNRPTGYLVSEVFPVEEIDGLPESFYKPEDEIEGLSPEERLKDADQILAELAPRFVESESNAGAFYSPMEDRIYMPAYKFFNSPLAFAATMMHETIHWTSHPSRMARPLGVSRQDPRYAFEELIAEIGSSFVLGLMGLEPPFREDHAPYIASWLGNLKQDKTALGRAIVDSQQAVNYLLRNSPTLRQLAGKKENEVMDARRGLYDAILPADILLMDEGYDDVQRIESIGNVNTLPFWEEEGTSLREMTERYPDALERLRSGNPTKDEREFGGGPRDLRSRDGLVYDFAGRLASGKNQGDIAPETGSTKGPIRKSDGDINFATVYPLKVPPTQEQRDAIDVVTQLVMNGENGVITMDASAGAGKTTTLKAIALAIASEFNFDRILLETEGNDTVRKQRIQEKIEHLAAKYPDLVDKQEWSKLQPEELPDAAQKVLEAIGNKTLYYGVFGKDNETEARHAFPRNTGVATTTKIYYHSLRNGGAKNNRPDNKIVNPDGIQKKLLIAGKWAKDLAGKSRGDTIVAEDELFLKPGDPRGPKTFTGERPSFKDLGWVELADGVDWENWLESQGLIKIVQATITENGKTFTIDRAVQFMGAPRRAHIVGAWFALAMRRWALSLDERARPEHFVPSQMQLEQRVFPQFTSRMRRGMVEALDLITDPSQVEPEHVGMLQTAIDRLLDGNSEIVPSQDQLPKVWLLTDPDLSTDPGLIGHSDLDSKVDVPVPNTVKQGDTIYVRDGKVEDENGQPFPPEGSEEWIVTKVNERTQTANRAKASIARRYASPSSPLSLLMIDESQDQNDLMAEAIRRNKDRITVVAVGDERQAIMAFNDAKNIMRQIEPDYVMPVTEAFRFSEIAGYLGTIVLAHQTLVNDKYGVTNHGGFKHVKGMSVQTMLSNMDQLMQLLKDGDFGGAQAKAKFIDQRYSSEGNNIRLEKKISDLLADIDSGEIKRGDTEWKKAIKAIQKEVDQQKQTIEKQLKTRLADVNEDYVTGEFPTMVLTRGNPELLPAAVRYLELREGYLAFKGQTYNEVDEQGKRLPDTRPPVVVIPQDKWNQAVGFFEHLDYVMRNPGGTQGRPPASRLIGDLWDMGSIMAAMRSEQSQMARSLWNMLRPTPGRGAAQLGVSPSAILRLLRGGKVNEYIYDPKFPGDKSRAQKIQRVVDPIIVPSRKVKIQDPFEIGGSERKGEGDASLPSISEIAGAESRDKTGVSKTKVSKFQKIEIIGASNSQGEDGVEMRLDYEFVGGLDSDDFDVIVEQLPGDPSERVRVVSKWNRQADRFDPASGGTIKVTVPKYETIAEFDESSDIEQLKKLALKRMERVLVRNATEKNSDAREAKYAKRELRWTGDIILTGDGLDTSRPTARYVDASGNVKVKALGGRTAAKGGMNRSWTGVYRAELRDIIDRSGLRGTIIEARNVGVRRNTQADIQARAWDGFIIRGNPNDPEETAKLVETISNRLREAAQGVGGDVVVQTGTTAKGKESRYVWVFDSTTNARGGQSGGFPDPKGMPARLYDGPTPLLKRGQQSASFTEESNLQHVVLTRPMQAIDVGRDMATSWLVPSARREIDEAIRAEIAAGRLPAFMDQSAQLDPKNPELSGFLRRLIEADSDPAITVIQDDLELMNPIRDAKTVQQMLALDISGLKKIAQRIDTALDNMRKNNPYMPIYTDKSLAVLIDNFAAEIGRRDARLMRNARDKVKTALLERSNSFGRFDPLHLPDGPLRQWAKQKNDYLKRFSPNPKNIDVEPFIERRNKEIADWRAANNLPPIGAGGEPSAEELIDSLARMRVDVRRGGEEYESEELEFEDRSVNDGETYDIKPDTQDDGFTETDVSDNDDNVGGQIPIIGDEGDDDTDATPPVNPDRLASGSRQRNVETFGGRLSSGVRRPEPDAPEGRVGRRMRYRRPTITVDGQERQLRPNALEIAQIRPDAAVNTERRSAALDTALQIWRGYRREGIMVDISSSIQDKQKRDKARNEAIADVGRALQQRRGSIVVGSTSQNRDNENPSSATWMLPVAKLLEAIRIPTEYRVYGDDEEPIIDVSDTRSLRTGELATLLGLPRSEAEKLTKPNAGINHDAVRYLLAAMGSHDEFRSWALFAPVTDAEAEREGFSAIERFTENAGRATMRDRFIIETFGADAYPYWRDNTNGNVMDAEEYSSDWAPDRAVQFLATGQFSRTDSTAGSSEAEVELAYDASIGADIPEVETGPPADKTKREEFKVDELLKYLGIPENANWFSELRDLIKSKYNWDPGLASRDEANKWKKAGIPTAHVYQMIKTGVIPDAARVWQEAKAGERFDQEMLASKLNVHEAVMQFIARQFPQGSPLNTAANRKFIFDTTENITSLLQAGAKARGSTYTKKKGDEPRYSMMELQQVVNRFNQIFGTNFEVSDIFSKEQLETARNRLEVDGQTVAEPFGRGVRRVRADLETQPAND